jgi:hypothetical protein
MPGFIIVDKMTILQGGPVPPQLEGYITQSEYSALCGLYQECEASTQCTSCFCETCICLLTGFICIYCAHPCITIGLVNMGMKP